MSGDSTQKVSLGCGTLILIALIVLLFSNGGGNRTAREITELKNSVTALRSEVVSLRQSIEKQDQLLRLRIPPQGTPPLLAEPR